MATRCTVEVALKDAIVILRGVKWFTLGIQLDIKKSELDRIKRENPQDEEQCMIEVLHYWLNNTLSGCTWDKLANAVERMGGESKVVENLRARQELNGDPAQPTTSNIPAFRSNLPHDDGLPDDSSTDSNTSSSQSEDHALISSSASTSSNALASPNAPTSPSDESPSGHEVVPFNSLQGCGCGHCTLHTLCKRPCPNPNSENPLRIWNCSENEQSVCDQKEREEQLKHETHEIMFLFATLVTLTTTFFENMKIPLKKVLEWLKYVEFLEPIVKKEAGSLGQEDKLQQVDQYLELFSILRDYWSWYNYDLLKHLIITFGSIKLKRELHGYKKQFKHYFKRRKQMKMLPLSQDSFPFGDDGRNESKILLVKVDEMWDEIPLAWVRTVHHKIATIFDVPMHTLYLSSVSRGCIQMKFFFLHSDADQLIQLSSSKKEALQENRIIEVKYRNECIFCTCLTDLKLAHETNSESSSEGYYEDSSENGSENEPTDDDSVLQSLEAHCPFNIPPIGVQESSEGQKMEGGSLALARIPFSYTFQNEIAIERLPREIKQSAVSKNDGMNVTKPSQHTSENYERTLGERITTYWKAIERHGNMQAQQPSGHKRKSSTSRTTHIRNNSPKRRRTESTSQETSHESPSNITCSQRETSHEALTCSHRGDRITSETDANQIDARVESSCPLPNKTYTDQIDDKPCEESTREAIECVVFHDRESTRLEEVIGTHRKEVVQHGNISELSSHLAQEGLLNHGESEYLQSGASNREKMSRVLDSLKEKPNGFTKFLTCIKREENHLGHAYITSLLEERPFAPDSDLQLSAECKKRIKDNMVTLVKNIDLSSLVHHLRQSFYLPCIAGRTQLLTHDETNKLLLGKETKQNRIRRLFFILETKGPLAHSRFARCVCAEEDHITHQELFKEVFEDLEFPPDPILPCKANADPLVESSCPVPSGADTSQIESKASEESTHKIEQLIASHHKEVVQHANISELSSHLVQEGLLNHDESEYLQSGASDQKKMSQLLNSLKEKPNGFGKFLKCIKRETRHMGHSYIASLLEERQFAPVPELRLSAECKKRIQNNMEKLVEGINLSSLVPHLGQSFYLPCIQGTTQLLTANEARKLLFGSDITQYKARLLFSILETKGPLAHSRFARCMYAAEDEKTHHELFEEVFENLNFSPDPILPWLNEEPASQSSKHKNGNLATDDKLLPFVPTDKTQLLETDGVLGGNCYDELMTNFYCLHHNSDGHHQLVTEAEKARTDLPLEFQALYQIELARSFIFQMQNKKAEELLSAVLELSGKILGNNAFFIIGRCHHTFADLFRITNDYDRAKKHSTRALMALHSVKPGLDTATAHYVNGCILLECLLNQHSVTPIDIRLIEKSFHSAINNGKDSDIARRVTLPQSHCGLAQLYMSSTIHEVTINEDSLKKARQSLDACKCQLGFISQISQHLYYVVEADWYRNSGNSSEAVRLAKEAHKIAERINYTLGILSAKARLESQ